MFTPKQGAEKFTFQAEVNRLMDIIIHSLYSNKVCNSCNTAAAHLHYAHAAPPPMHALLHALGAPGQTSACMLCCGEF